MNDANWPFQIVERIVRSGANTREGMLELINICQDECPGPAWEDLRSLNFDEGVVYLKNWLLRVLSNERPPANIKAFWFGIHNPSYNGKESCDLYLSGSTLFEPAATNGDWACWNEESYIPHLRYANSSILEQIYRLVRHQEPAALPQTCRWRGLCSGSNSCWFGEYVLCLGFSALAVHEVCQSIWKPIMATAEERQAVAVGFDDGDFILLGYIDKDGWYPDHQ